MSSPIDTTSLSYSHLPRPSPPPPLHLPLPLLHLLFPSLHLPSPSLHLPSPSLHLPSPSFHLPFSTAPLTSSTVPLTSSIAAAAPPYSSSSSSRTSKRIREETVELIVEIIAKRLHGQDDASIGDLTSNVREQSRIFEMQSCKIDDLEEHNSRLEEEVVELRTELEELKASYTTQEAAARVLYTDLCSFWHSCRDASPDF